MSVNTSFSVPKNTLTRAVQLASQNNAKGAMELIESSFALNGEQRTAIAAILQSANKDPLEAPNFQKRIVAILSGEALETQEIATNKDFHLFSAEDVSDKLSMFHPCIFEFGGTLYLSGDACFKAQHSNNTEDVLMHVQRAKFGQNPELKTQLLATGSSYIACQGHDLFFSNCMVGTGQNSLGKCLMRLRGEYGGIGIVEPPKSYQEEVRRQTSFHFLTNTLCQDVIQHLFTEYVSEGDIQCIGALSRVNTHYNQMVNKCWERFSLKQFCPKGLTILDLKTMGFEGVEPKISHFEVLKAFYELAHHVEGNAGCTLLTMPEGLTLNLLVAIGSEMAMTTCFTCDDTRPGELEELPKDVPVIQTYVIMVTNNVFIKSRTKSVAQLEIQVGEHRCQMPTVQEYISLCIFTKKLFDKCLYGNDPWTYGQSSTRFHNYPLLIGLSQNSITVSKITFDHGYECNGAGGRRELQAMSS